MLPLPSASAVVGGTTAVTRERVLVSWANGSGQTAVALATGIDVAARGGASRTGIRLGELRYAEYRDERADDDAERG